MSGLQPITYRSITDTVLNFILGYCFNVDNVDKLSAEFKADYVYDRVIDERTIRYKINNPIRPILSSTIRNQFNSFITEVGIANKIDSNVSEEDFITLLNDMVIFCCSKIRFAETPLKNIIAPVYIDGEIPFDSLMNVGFPYSTDWNYVTLSDEDKKEKIDPINKLFTIVSKSESPDEESFLSQILNTTNFPSDVFPIFMLYICTCEWKHSRHTQHTLSILIFF